MDKDRFDEIVEEYMMFNKRTLAELLALRDLKAESNPFVDFGAKIVTRRYCIGLGDYCNSNRCNGCLFSIMNQQIKSDGVYVVKNPDCVSVSTTDGKPDYTTTTSCKM